MKKLITGAIAAMALLLGFAACSGDLHDNDVQPLYVVGAGFEGASWDLATADAKVAQATLVESDGSVQKFELKATASTAQVKFATARSWSNDIAGSDTQELFPVVNGDVVSLFSREANALPNTQNVVINDLTVGETYIIDINFNPISLATSIKVSGNAVVAPDMQIIVSTGESKPTISKIPMTRAGATYTYEFIAAKTLDNLSFYFYCPSLNATYYVNNNELVQIDVPLKDAHGNNLNTDGNVVTDNSYALGVWEKANKQPIVKDHKYSIKIEANDSRYGFNGSISYSALEEAILENAVLIGQWEYADNHDGDYAVDFNGAYTFTAKNKSVEFKVLRDKSEDTMTWGDDVSITAGKDYELGDAKKLTYNTTLVLNDENGFAYKVPKEGKSALNGVKYIKADGLDKGTKYTIYLKHSADDTPYNADLGKFEICLAKVAPPKALNEEVAKCGIRGSLNNSWDDVKEKNADESTSNSFVFGPFTTVNPQFKLATADWKDLDHQYTYTENPITVENEKDATATVTLRQSADGDGNITVKGIAEGAEYKIIIDVDNEEQSVKCTVKITKSGAKDERSNIQKFAEDNYIKGEIASGSWDNKVYAASSTYATDKKSVTIKYGPLPKSNALDSAWLLTDDSVFYRSCKLRYVDLNDKKGTEVKLVADTGAANAKNNEITDATFEDNFYYIVVRATTDENGNIDAVYAKIEPTKDSKIPYLSTLVITIPGTGNYKASTLTIVNLPKPQGDTLDVDGSLFSWDKGSAGVAKYNAGKAVFEVTATGLDNSSWIGDESPFKDNYPDGADTSAKLKLYGEDKYYCFKNGGSYTFVYSDRK